MSSAPPDDTRTDDPRIDGERTAPPFTATRSDRFFSWTSGLGVVRGEGWLGGVAAGVAARIGVDPLIVRGILVVLGMIGFPVLLAYGIAWALLPALDGRVPLQQAMRGRFESSQVGAALCVVIGLLPPPASLFLGLPTVYSMAFSSPTWFATFLLLTIVALAIAGGLVFFIVRAAGRTPGGIDADLRTASAASAAPEPSDVDPGGDPGPQSDTQGEDVASHAHVDAASLSAPLEPSAPANADDAEMERWRAQHAAWKEQDQKWRTEQQDAARAAREALRRERQARAAAFAAEAAERRRQRRATSPRTPFAFVAVVLGVAVVVGALIGLQGGELAVSRGLFAAALVLGIAMVAAGILRRRSGFLAFATVLTLVGGAAGAAVPTAQALHIGGYGISNIGAPRYPASAPFVQPWGNLTVFLDDTGDSGETHIQKRSGNTTVTVMPGVDVELVVTTTSAGVFVSTSGAANDSYGSLLEEAPGAVSSALPDGRTRYTALLRHPLTGGPGDEDDPATTTEKLVIDQDSGYVDVYLQAPDTIFIEGEDE